MRVTVITDLGRETHQGLVTEIQTHLGLEAEVVHVAQVRGEYQEKDGGGSGERPAAKKTDKPLKAGERDRGGGS